MLRDMAFDPVCQTRWSPYEIIMCENRHLALKVIQLSHITLHIGTWHGQRAY